MDFYFTICYCGVAFSPAELQLHLQDCPKRRDNSPVLEWLAELKENADEKEKAVLHAELLAEITALEADGITIPKNFWGSPARS